MNLERFKVLFFVVTAVLALLVASPALHHFIVYPQTQYFTELYLLAPNHTTQNYPYNLTTNQNYHVYLGLSNHLGSCGYYMVEVKFRNQTMLGPDNLQGTPSSLPTLYRMNVVVADKQTVELPVDFAFDYNNDGYNVNFNKLTINNQQISLNGYLTSWNQTNYSFYGKLVFELWLYNSTLGSFEYNHRFVDLRLNMAA
jgi:uncharacterized membrane protein